MRSLHLACLCSITGLILACSSETRVQDGPTRPVTGGASGASTASNGAEAGEVGGSGATTGGGAALTGGAGAGGTAGDASGGVEVGGVEVGGVEVGGVEVGGETTGGAPTGGSGDSGASAAGGEGASGGDASDGGAATGGESLGGATTGGAATGGENLAGGDTGGTSTGGATTGGAGGVGGDATVRGRLIDFWGHELPGVALEVDGAPTTTDDDGEFEVEGVWTEYDVSLVVNAGVERRVTHGWLFQGLTRRDPTLQIYDGLEERSGDYTARQSGAELGANRGISVGCGSADGAQQYLSPDLGVTRTMTWRGETTTVATVHGLLFQYDPDTTLPNDYLAYAESSPAVFSADDPADLTLDLTPPATRIPTDTLQGSVVPDVGLDRQNAVFLRFTSGAPIELARMLSAPDAFSVLVPTISRSSVTVVASEGGFRADPFALVHADGLGASSVVAVAIPTPSTLLLPLAGAAGVTAATPFTFRRGEGDGAVIVRIQRDGYLDTLNVVTASEELTLPEFSHGALAIQPAATYAWFVETHGDAATVDELAGPSGFLDAFAWWEDYPAGPRRGSGTFTRSAKQSFTTAP